MAITTTPLGFKKPDGLELVKGGDNVIADNAQTAQDLIAADRVRLGAIEALTGPQSARMTAAEASITATTSRVAAVESVNATQNNRLTAAESYINGAGTSIAAATTRVAAVESVNAAQDIRLASVESAAFVGGGLLTEDPADPGFYLVGAP